MTTKLSPSDCESMADLLSMDETTTIIGRFGMLIQHDQAVVLTEQRPGERCLASITIPKKVFQRLIEWYQTPQ